MSVCINISIVPNIYLMIKNPKILFNTPKRYYSVLSADDKFYMSHIGLSLEIESIYNDEWKNRGVLPLDKVKLQHRILRKKFPLLEQAHLAYYKLSELPEFIYNGLVNEAKAGVRSATIMHQNTEGELNVPDGVLWIYTYEMPRPEDLLLLSAATNIMLKKYVQKPLYMSKPLIKITQLHDYHHESLNQLSNVHSIHKIKLYPNHLCKFYLSKYSNVIFRKNAMLLKILINYFNMPVLNTINGKLFSDIYVAPLGDFTTALYHIIYTYIFDIHFASKYPQIEFTRWGNDAFIINKMDSKHHINDTEILAFVDSLDDISCQIDSIYSIDDTAPHQLEYYESPYNYLALNTQTYYKIMLNDSGKVTVQKETTMNV